MQRLIGPSATVDRANVLAANKYFNNGNKRKKNDMQRELPPEWNAVIPDYLFEVKNTYDLLKREILSAYETDSMGDDDWQDIKDLEGYTAVVVNDLHSFDIKITNTEWGMTKLCISFSYGGVFRTSPEVHDFHDLWRGRMPAPPSDAGLS